jgi:hypothetical protein
MITDYDDILAALKTRILAKHEKYGLSYLDESCTFEWLLKVRLEGELVELYKALVWEQDNIINEALDVAICALLIADKQAKEESL